MTKIKIIWQNSVSICFVTISFELKYSLLKGGGRLIRLKLNPQVSRSSRNLQDSQVILHISSHGYINSSWWWTGYSPMEQTVRHAGNSRMQRSWIFTHARVVFFFSDEAAFELTMFYKYSLTHTSVNNPNNFRPERDNFFGLLLVLYWGEQTFVRVSPGNTAQHHSYSNLPGT